jgi:hypothetical protein
MDGKEEIMEKWMVAHSDNGQHGLKFQIISTLESICLRKIGPGKKWMETPTIFSRRVQSFLAFPRVPIQLKLYNLDHCRDGRVV